MGPTSYQDKAQNLNYPTVIASGLIRSITNGENSSSSSYQEKNYYNPTVNVTPFL